MANYTIKDIELLSGIKAHTLRIWEQRYDFLKPDRTDTNIRYYSDELLKKILNVSLLNRNGYKISRIADMSETELRKEVIEITQQNQTPDNLLDALTQCMIDFDEKRFEKYLSIAIARHGFEKAFSEMVFPFLIRTGTLWSTGTVLPVQEHFISNLIRRKILAATDNLFTEQTENSKRFVLFLPEGETHELVLLFMEYILRKNNHHVAYIGSSTPLDDIDLVNKAFKPDYLVTYVTIPQTNITLNKFLESLAKAYPSKSILIGGVQLEVQAPKLLPNVHIINSISDLLAAVK